MRKHKKFFKSSKIIVSFIFILGTVLFFGSNYVNAGAIRIEYTQLLEELRNFKNQDKSQHTQDKTEREEDKQEQTLGSKLFHSVLGSVLNTIAYDTATWLGSGGEGQKPMFMTENWDEFLTNMADNAAGEFLETLGSENGFVKFNLCQPNFDVSLSIGLGLVQYTRPTGPDCKFSQMVDNWENALQDPNFINNIQDMFEPTSSDLGIALSVNTGMVEAQQAKLTAEGLDRNETDGWLDLRDIAGRRENPPTWAKTETERLKEGLDNNIAQWTGDVLVDAANVFLNQLAITAINTLIKKLGEKAEPYSSKYEGNLSGLFRPDAGPSAGGISATKEKLRRIIEPRFNVRGDYDILTELAICPNPTKAGPTNCVIEQRLRRAIEDKMTVGEALNQGLLNPNGIFGYAANGIEPPYNQGYPYRSMVILRKFRIIPVGWELAAQFIRDNPDITDGTKNMWDMVACFSNTDFYAGYYAPWCEGLIDPGWVLKAPLNYCKREGPGPEILSEQISGEEEETELTIQRNDNYCADEQACIKEYDDGSCQLYGYCTEERRTWNFNAESCDPLYNTCETFRSRNGQTYSYLENTLDYSICSVDNVGCLGYCANYTGTAFDCSAPDTILFMDKDASECNEDSEGCHEFIRTKRGLGVNLIRNASFEEIADIDLVDDSVADTFRDHAVTAEAVSANDNSYHGNIGMQLSAGFTKVLSVGPTDIPLAGESFAISFYAKNCSAGDTFTFESNTTTGADVATENIIDGIDWEYNSLVYLTPFNVLGNTLTFNINSNTCIIDALKIERGNNPTRFADYRDRGVVYQKLAPAYLGCSSSGGDPRCDDFIRYCTAQEVGCQLFTAVSDNISVPAKVLPPDYCPAECVGYDEYLQKETAFDSERPAYFIPENAQRCNAQADGCDEFTNLDELEQGGEAIEHYSQLKQCIDPNDPTAVCQEYYTWEGSADTGYQLRVHSLQSSGGNPDLTNAGQYDGMDCAVDTDYDLTINPMCREFFDTSGVAHYRFLPYVITCSDDCHPYRRSEDNIATDLLGGNLSAAQCNALSVRPGDIFHDGTQCHFCKNNGVWNAQHQACIYYAVPQEGVMCNGSMAGCREYRGDRGNNLRVMFVSDFEGNTQNWSGVLSSNALMVGGESLQVTNTTERTIGTMVRAGGTYIIRFIASPGAPGINLTVRMENGSGSSTSFQGTANLSGAVWNQFELNLTELTHVPDANERLIIEGTGLYYIDDIRLIEVSDRYYLIKNSWYTPDSCFEDIFGTYVGVAHNLGCEEYIDQDTRSHYLRNFSSLCLESAVGCEVMIDTHNYYDYEAAGWNDGGDLSCAGDGEDCEIVPADNYVYAVYNSKKRCNNSDLGCSLLGLPNRHAGSSTYSSIYLNNNPNEYNEILCREEADGCEEWTTRDSAVYFKDPGLQVCEWRQEAGSGEGNWNWYKGKIKRCDENDDGVINVSGVNPNNFMPIEGPLCGSDNDCASGPCIVDENDYICSTFGLKTIGYGGAGNVIVQPEVDSNGYWWAGACPANESGCTEYVDPASKFSTNEVFNADFSANLNTADVPDLPDGWEGSDQDVELKRFTLYRIGGTATGDLTLDCQLPIFELNQDNNLQAIGLSLGLPASAGTVSRLFYSGNNDECLLSNNNLTGEVEIRRVMIDYQIEGEVDRETCNGIVNYDDGCVLFNERQQNGIDMSSFTWDTDVTWDDYLANNREGVSPQNGVVGEQDVNALIKVRPDRICDEWLACRSFIKNAEGESVCFGIGLCDSVDQNGNCDNFVSSNIDNVLDFNDNQTYNGAVDADSFANMSGYHKAGYGFNLENQDYYPFGAMEQIGEGLYLTNGNFEISGENDYPIGWNLHNSTLVWSEDFFKVIDNPYEAQNEGVGYAPEGRSFIKVGEAHQVASDFIEVVPDGNYVVSAMMNTLNLSTGVAEVQIMQYNSGESEIGISSNLSLGRGNDWTFQNRLFLTTSDTAKIKLILTTTGTGNFYVDDVKIKPALHARSNTYLPQTCRLYPDSQALSCDYIEDTGIRMKGIWGYCMEYDRYPGSSDTCLTWWPVDRVKGNGVTDQDEFSGYTGKFPLYYCDYIRANFELVEHRRERFLRSYSRSGWTFLGTILTLGLGPLFDPGSSDFQGRANICPSESDGIQNGGYYIRVEIDEDSGFFRTRITYYYYCSPIRADRITGSYRNGWFRYNGNLVKFSGMRSGWDETRDGVRIWDPDIASHPFDPEDYNIACQKIWQTVNATGQNKTWMGRVYTASEYRTHGTDYGFETDDTPFGSAVPPEPESNPYEWDSSPLVGLQPLYLLDEEGDPVRAGSPYECAGNQCFNLGYCDISGNVCLYIPINNPTGVIRDCRVDNTNPCYENWEQTFLACPWGETCNRSLFDIENVAPPATPREDLKRLFAQSYGSWEWQGVEGYCEDDPDQTPPPVCTHNTNQCPNGICQARCKMYYRNGNSSDPDVLMDQSDAGGNSIVEPACGTTQAAVAGAQTFCDNNSIYVGDTIATLNAAATCDTYANVCGPGGAICIGNACCIPMSSGSCCGDGNGDGYDDCNDACCLSAAEYTACTNYYTTTLAGQNVCTNSYHACSTDADCQYYTACEWDTCTGGANDNGACSEEHACPGSYCVLDSYLAGRYMPVTDRWVPPSYLCSDAAGNNIRSTWSYSSNTDNNMCNGCCGDLAPVDGIDDCGGAACPGDCFSCPGENCDFCAVIPIVDNITVKDELGNPSPPPLPVPRIRDSDYVELTFTSEVDEQQLPLVSYTVDWGDGTRTIVSGIEMRHHPSPENPHALYHLYSYWDLVAKASAGVGNVYCPSNINECNTVYGVEIGTACCTVIPGVKIKDNWGWCNNGNDIDGLCPVGLPNEFVRYDGAVVVTED